MLGRTPPDGMARGKEEFVADWHIGRNVKISRKHAMISWSARKNRWRVRRVSRNGIKVDEKGYDGAKLQSRSRIDIKGAPPLYFVLPKQQKQDPVCDSEETPDDSTTQ